MIKFTIDTKNLSRDFKRQSNAEVQKQFTAILTTAVNELKSVTPVDTKLASESWSLAVDGQEAEITNAQEYVKFLNAGSSKQAPAFFIEQTMLNYGKPKGSIVNYKE
jgi:hypothetical protein